MGGGQNPAARVGTYVDEIISRMRDGETMTVVSLLSKLFIHTSVPDNVCSLEAWHVLLDLPRTLSSRIFTGFSMNDTKAFKATKNIQQGAAEEPATKLNKLDHYLARLKSGTLTIVKWERMSFSSFISRVDCHRTYTIRDKSKILKEKPYLHLDARRRDAANMARFCLRLHRPFSTASQDPMKLSESDAVSQLQDFLESTVCPLWIKLRYTKHNRIRKLRPPPVLGTTAGTNDDEQTRSRDSTATGEIPAQSAVNLNTAGNSHTDSIVAAQQPADIGSDMDDVVTWSCTLCFVVYW
jgi:hypothetical protein